RSRLLQLTQFCPKNRYRLMASLTMIPQGVALGWLVSGLWPASSAIRRSSTIREYYFIVFGKPERDFPIRPPHRLFFLLSCFPDSS
ncbi:MAG: hypothetical protein ABJF10_27535, partial [Chthoniobacter sp.]|uniref:hypothetical protein n=1 Tax=Chthoniobacter sp. TaxID=2510640 RepID=UPI0032A96B10